MWFTQKVLKSTKKIRTKKFQNPGWVHLIKEKKKEII